MCILIFSTTFVQNISHFNNKWARYDQNESWSPCKLTVFLSNFNETYFLNRFLKNAKISNFIKICPVRGEMSHEDRQTDMMKLILTFHNSVNMPYKSHNTWNK